MTDQSGHIPGLPTDDQLAMIALIERVVPAERSIIAALTTQETGDWQPSSPAFSAPHCMLRPGFPVSATMIDHRGSAGHLRGVTRCPVAAFRAGTCRLMLAELAR